jgi:hypothetical protein
MPKGLLITEKPSVTAFGVLESSRRVKSGAKMFGFDVENALVALPAAGEGDSSNCSDDMADDTPGDLIAESAGLSLTAAFSLGDILDWQCICITRLN